MDLERRQRIEHVLLVVPALAVIVLVVALPIAWMFVLSFLGEDGRFTLENYQIFFTRGGYLGVIGTTFEVSVVVALLTLLLGYPVTYLLVGLSRRLATFALLAIMLPYLTSILVRTYAWLVLLGRRGIVNSTLMSLGWIDDPLPLLYNLTGTVVGMVHIMLPLLVLPLYGSMKSIDPNLMRAASNLGASPLAAFWRVYFRLSLPGVAAGTFLVFVSCLGFFITPAILGGGRVVMMAQQIAKAVAVGSHFGVASALGVGLLTTTVTVLMLGRRLLRFEVGRL
ncbi:MAG: ABC transporter permease [Proteobacteria bacterium]|nr:ABC transporter permease [Pseudomonadota bacterium]MBI3500138.1 ABC transporter permease [Pseudomonadota bacterium]